MRARTPVSPAFLFVQDAQHAVNECVSEYNAMLNQLDDAKKAEVMRSMGMKMEQVRAACRALPCWTLRVRKYRVRGVSIR